MRRLIFTLVLLLAPALTDGGEKPTIESLTPLLEQYFDYPRLMERLEVEICEVDELWDEMGIQILKVREVSRNPSPVETSYLLYHNCVLAPFVPSFGGDGLMSAVLVDHKLYYSYSGSAGIHQSRIGQLSVHKGRLTRIESEDFYSRDVFVTRVDDRIQVQTGNFAAFNRWTDKTAVGWLKLEKFGLVQASRLTIVDDFGDDISPYYNNPLSWINAPRRWIVMAQDGEEQTGARFRIETPELFGNIQSTLFPAACRPIDVADHSVEFATDVDPPLGECEPREPWINLTDDEEDHVAALFSIRE